MPPMAVLAVKSLPTLIGTAGEALHMPIGILVKSSNSHCPDLRGMYEELSKCSEAKPGRLGFHAQAHILMLQHHG